MSIDKNLLLAAKTTYINTLMTQPAPADTIAMGQAALSTAIIEALICDGVEKSEFNTTAIKSLLTNAAAALDIVPV